MGAFANDNIIKGVDIVEEAQFTLVVSEEATKHEQHEQAFVEETTQKLEEVVDAPVVDRKKLAYAVSSEGVLPEIAQGKLLKKQIYSEMRNPTPNFNANPCRMLRQMIDSTVIGYNSINMTRDEFAILEQAYNYNMGVKLTELFVTHEVMRRQSVLDNIMMYAEIAGVQPDRLYHNRTTFIKASSPSNIHPEEIVDAYRILNEIKSGMNGIVIRYELLVDIMDRCKIDYVDLNISHEEFCKIIKKQYKKELGEHAPNVMLVKRKLRQQQLAQGILEPPVEEPEVIETTNEPETTASQEKVEDPQSTEQGEVKTTPKKVIVDPSIDDLPSFSATAQSDETPQEKQPSESANKQPGMASKLLSSVTSRFQGSKLFGKGKAVEETNQDINATEPMPEVDPVEKRKRDFKAAVKLTMPTIKRALEGKAKGEPLKGLNEGVDYPKLKNCSNEQKYFFWKMNNNISADGRFILSEVFEKVWTLTPENFPTLFKEIKGMFAGMPMEDRNLVHPSEIFKNDVKVLDMVKDGSLFDIKNKRFREVFH